MPSYSADLRTPLLQFTPSPSTNLATNPHLQFCQLIGMPPLQHPSLPPLPSNAPRPDPNTLYQRTRSRLRSQSRVYLFTASLANTLLLAQVVLGAALTGLGATDSSRVLITLFGALNTVIAGLVAYLKSRGQPMRARMYREDLERLVEDVEASATMWLGVATATHGYDAIDTDAKVTVRGEVARLYRLWDQAVRRNVSNDPDMYAAGAVGDAAADGLRHKNGQPAGVAVPVLQQPAPGVAPPAGTVQVPPAAAAVVEVVSKVDESPATSDLLKDGKSEEAPKKAGDVVVKAPEAAASSVQDPDASPATAPLEDPVKREGTAVGTGAGSGASTAGSSSTVVGSGGAGGGAGGGAAAAAALQATKANESLKRTTSSQGGPS